MGQSDDFAALARCLVAEILEDARLRSFAREVAGLVLDDPRFRQAVREVVLRVVEEQERQSGTAPAREFLRACEARGVTVAIERPARNGDQDVLLCTPLERLGADLEAVLRMRREEITRFVKHQSAK